MKDLGSTFGGLSDSVLVGPGIKFTLPDYNVDIDGNGITINRLSGGTSNSFWGGSARWLTLSSLDWINDPTGIIASIQTSGTNVEVDQNGVTFSDNEVFLALDGVIDFGPNGTLRLDLVTAHTPVPLPPMLLMVTGLLSLFGYQRLGKKTA